MWKVLPYHSKTPYDNLEKILLYEQINKEIQQHLPPQYE